HSGTGWLRELTEERQFGGAVGPIKSDQGRCAARKTEIALRVGRRRRLARIELPVIVEIGKDRRARNVTFDDLLRKQELRGRQIAFGEILQEMVEPKAILVSKPFCVIVRSERLCTLVKPVRSILSPSATLKSTIVSLPSPAL